MVGIVIVSHMVSIADGVRDMAKKIASPDLTVIAAGGAPDGSFGTDSTKICKAVEDADNGKTVLSSSPTWQLHYIGRSCH